ncbi:alpha/beta hydrolase family protein [Tetraselmis virus 1]|uniref:Alpha/beta hydrolase family protein n=1 Tax=Tetraselmis virus 1 TaxID=2060617 RepID=A0A2P0VMS1_9VIRU|nr:alpha/beta hydrolase family protein [Tetraselmis virus 1]AUF82180.1 alpha/beta hydrolase family protein [Tetraselmis virus 1]
MYILVSTVAAAAMYRIVTTSYRPVKSTSYVPVCAVSKDKTYLCNQVIKYTPSIPDMLEKWNYEPCQSDLRKWVAWFIFYNREEYLLGNQEYENCVKMLTTACENELLDDYVKNTISVQEELLYMKSYKLPFFYKYLNSFFHLRFSYRMKYSGFSDPISLKYGRCWIKFGGDRTVVFIHGLGFGIWPYETFIKKLDQQLSGDCTIVCIEFDHLIASWSDKCPKRGEVAKDVLSAMDYAGATSAVFVGHSFGTAKIAQVYSEAPHAVEGMVLMAPVCLIPHCLDSTFNFIFKGRSSYNIFHRTMAYDNTIINTINCTWWHKTTLWPDELRDVPIMVVLAEHDQLISTNILEQHILDNFQLRSGNRELMIVKGKHGAMVFNNDSIHQVCKNTKLMFFS